MPVCHPIEGAAYCSEAVVNSGHNNRLRKANLRPQGVLAARSEAALLDLIVFKAQIWLSLTA